MNRSPFGEYLTSTASLAVTSKKEDRLLDVYVLEKM